jgi:hypothetical protein
VGRRYVVVMGIALIVACWLGAFWVGDLAVTRKNVVLFVCVPAALILVMLMADRTRWRDDDD